MIQKQQKILPLNNNPSITSYVQHSYPLSIIESQELISLYVSNIDNCKLAYIRR